MSEVTYVEQNGTKHEIDLPEGISVMQGALNNGVPGIDGDCGGGMCLRHMPRLRR